MSTYILGANDTIMTSNSVVMKFTESVNACLSSTKESATNWADVEIAKWIMCSIAAIVAICVVGYIIVKLIDAFAKFYAEKQKRRWGEKDNNRKRRNELLNMKLEMLKEQCYTFEDRIETVEENHKHEKDVKTHDGSKSQEKNNCSSEEKTEVIQKVTKNKREKVIKRFDGENEKNEIKQYLDELENKINGINEQITSEI